MSVVGGWRGVGLGVVWCIRYTYGAAEAGPGDLDDDVAGCRGLYGDAAELEVEGWSDFWGYDGELCFFLREGRSG